MQNHYAVFCRAIEKLVQAQADTEYSGTPLSFVINDPAVAPTYN